MQGFSRHYQPDTRCSGLKCLCSLWSVIAVCFFIDLCWIVFSPYGIDFSGTTPQFLAVSGLLAVVLLYTYARPDRRIAAMARATLQLVLFSMCGSVLSYLMATFSFSLWDETFIVWDRWLGFDWTAYIDALENFPKVAHLLSFSYMSMLPQMALAVLVLVFYGAFVRLDRFILAVMLTALICIAISALMPAQAYHAFLNSYFENRPGLLHPIGSNFITDFRGLRDGTLTVIPLVKVDGIITFPSYHAALGLLLIYAFWPVRLLCWGAVLLNALMIFSTMADGGHYLVDVIAGIGVAGVILWLLEHFSACNRRAEIAPEKDLSRAGG